MNTPPKAVELEMCGIVKWNQNNPELIFTCKDKDNNLYLCSSYYSDRLNQMGIGVIVSEEQMKDYFIGIADIRDIFIENSKSDNEYDVWISNDLKHTRKRTSAYIVANRRETDFEDHMLPESYTKINCYEFYKYV